MRISLMIAALAGLCVIGLSACSQGEDAATDQTTVLTQETVPVNNDRATQPTTETTVVESTTAPVDTATNPPTVDNNMSAPMEQTPPPAATDNTLNPNANAPADMSTTDNNMTPTTPNTTTDTTGVAPAEAPVNNNVAPQ